MLSFKSERFASLADQTIYCQEAEGHNLEGFSIDLASLIEGKLSDGEKYLFYET